MTALSFFAVAFLLTFTFPADGRVYQTNDAIIIEGENLFLLRNFPPFQSNPN
jgi:hypothetical protein